MTEKIEDAESPPGNLEEASQRGFIVTTGDSEIEDDPTDYKPRQWRHKCVCRPGVAEERHVNKWVRMHSEISGYNAEYFAAKKTPDDVTEKDLLNILDSHDGQRVLCCNVCNAIRVVDDGTETEESDPEYDWSVHG